MRILILGAGGTGGYFGGRLVEGGADITFLVRPARAARLAETGLRIVSPYGDATLAVKTVTADQDLSGFDLVILSCKAYDLDGAVASIRPAVGPNTLVLPLLNGLRHMDVLDAAFGRDRVLGGLCHLAVTLDADGTIRHLNKNRRLTFGERDGDTPRGAEIAKALGVGDFDLIHSPAIVQEQWEKYSFLASLAAMTCLMRASVGTIMATSEGEAIMLELLAECEGTAAASGYPIGEAAHGFSVRQLTDKASPLTASMLRDLTGGGRTEGDHILGDMLKRARDLGVAAPILRLAACNLQAYEAGRG
jgi:2-dehydropantoate 2-reductase